MVEGQVRDGRTDGQSTFVEQKRIKNKYCRRRRTGGCHGYFGVALSWIIVMAS